MSTLLILITFIIFIFYVFIKRKPNFPPGPIPLPIVGTVYITKDAPHLAGIKLAKKYGPIVGMKFGSQPSVMLHGSKLIKEAFNESILSGRRANEATAFLIGDEYGILQATGEVWREQRRFSMRTLRDFGFGRASMEDMILEEAKELCDWLKKQNGGSVELNDRFHLAVVNSLWRILTGERHEHDDKALLEILDNLESTQKELLDFSSPLKVCLLFFYPKVAKFFPNYTGWKNLERSARTRKEMFDKIISEHSDSHQPDSLRDFVDVYLEEIQNSSNKSSSFHPSVGKNSLRSVISDLFFAGSDTTSVTLNWAVLYLLHHPAVQEKLQAEIDSVLGTTRPPKLADRKSLPYTECVIMEVMRYSSILPIGVSHTCMENTKLGGYDIPKGTIINSNLYHLHHDPEVWGDPEVFRPERFLNLDGTCCQRHESLMPFSVGRRVCMGENLARDTLFIFIACLLQNFNIKGVPGSERPSLSPKLGNVTLQPHKYKVLMEYRH